MSYRFLKLLVLTLLSAWPISAQAMEEAMRFHHIQAELSTADWGTADALVTWDGFAWYGGDKARLWIKTEGERDRHGLEESEAQMLLSVPVSRFWDVQAGIRQELDPRSDTHAVVALMGLAPYFFEIDASLFVSQRGIVSMRAEAELDLLLTQQMILSPHAELEAYAQDDTRRGTRAGLADIEAGLQLRYEITRKFAPFIELHHSRTFGGTRDLVRGSGRRTEDTQVRVGLRAWLN